MKRTSCFTSLVWLTLVGTLACGPGPAVPPPIGGQSGDDGGGQDPNPDPPIPPVPPGIPEPPCDPQPSELGGDELTAFGASVQGLLEGLELGDNTPLFWVPYDGVPMTTFSPGPGQTSLSLGLTLSPAAVSSQMLWIPDAGGVTCPPDTLTVPVIATLTTADGALDERFEASLEFTNAKVASLRGELSPETLGGTFSFDRIAAPDDGWRARLLQVYADIWPGGSRGGVLPVLERPGSTVAVPPASISAPGVLPADSPPPAPVLPAHHAAVAVWPRVEVCPNDGRGGTVVAAAERVIGWSALDVVAALAADAAWSLSSAEGRVAVDVALEPPSGLVCASTNGPALELDVRARLRAEGAPPGSPLERLDASTILRVGARAAADGSGLVQLRWARRDAGWSAPREAFEASTGVALDAPEEYRDIWWSWHGLGTRADVSAEFGSRASLAVTSLNAQQAAVIERIVAQGGPGAGIGLDSDGLPVLPGDTLLVAESAP